MNPCAQVFSPISPATGGIWAATGASVEFQQLSFEQVLKLYTCQAAARLPAGSVGLYASHWLRSFAYASPPARIRFLAPVARIASTRSCMPATWYPMPGQV